MKIIQGKKYRCLVDYNLTYRNTMGSVSEPILDIGEEIIVEKVSSVKGQSWVNTQKGIIPLDLFLSCFEEVEDK